MASIKENIKRLLLALDSKEIMILLDRTQDFSYKRNRITTKITAHRLVPTEEYNKDKPYRRQKNPKFFKYVKVKEFECFGDRELLLKLIDLWKKAENKVGEEDEQKKTAD